MSSLIFFVILGVLIVVHEFGHFIIAKKVGVKVEQFSLGFGPNLLRRKFGDTEYSISAIPLGGFVKMAGDDLEQYKGKPFEFYSKSILQRAMIIFFGPLLNYLLGFLIFWFIFFVGYPAVTNKIGGLKDGYGAKLAGLQVGDRVLAVDGVKVALWEDLFRNLQMRKDPDRVLLAVQRGSTQFDLDVKVTQQQLDDSGKKRSVGLLGIISSDETVKVKYGIFQSFTLGLERTWDLTTLTYQVLGRIFTGRLSLRDSVAGPLSMYDLTAKTAKMGLIAVVNLTALLSISLAIFNLLPFPVLDGGHILFLGLEKLRKKPLSLKVDRAITQLGFTMLISLMLFVTYNDVVRLFGDKISKFFGRL